MACPWAVARAQKTRTDYEKKLGGSAAKIQAVFRGHQYRKTAVKPKKGKGGKGAAGKKKKK